uniref:Lens epithelium-derived growth factor integrase-binding domain-containing protein n=1 Tax=Haplochromis burtoni TaxID=8153 RepID=A0A3Q2V898_HAPBU
EELRRLREREKEEEEKKKKDKDKAKKESDSDSSSSSDEGIDDHPLKKSKKPPPPPIPAPSDSDSPPPAEDIERCLQALEELEAVPVTSQILHKNAEVIATLKKIRRYKASTAVMEKASDVYNKLKLRFVGKAEVAAKPKTENKEPENDEEKETENTADSTPVNGESEQKKNDTEGEEKPKSPVQDENNVDTASSPNRRSPDSSAEQQTHTYEEEDDSISHPSRTTAVDQVLKDGGLCLT